LLGISIHRHIPTRDRHCFVGIRPPAIRNISTIADSKTMVVLLAPNLSPCFALFFLGWLAQLLAIAHTKGTSLAQSSLLNLSTDWIIIAKGSHAGIVSTAPLATMNGR
jgi:hypothetical protein